MNASLLYYVAKNEGLEAVIGSTRPVSLQDIDDHQPFADCGTLIKATSRVNSRGRYSEPRVAEELREEVVYFSREFKGKKDRKRFGEAIKVAQQKFGFTDIFFIDGGGDSLIIKPEDFLKHGKESDPFKGGDADLLAALHESKITGNIYQGVIAVGLDIDETAFQENIELLSKRGGYYGRVNLRTGEKQFYRLDHLFQCKEGFLQPYFNLADKILAYNESDLKNKRKNVSHTGTVTFRALKGEFGLQRTYVPWEPNINGEKGIQVKPEHCWMYIVDPREVEKLKIELYQKRSKQ